MMLAKGEIWQVVDSRGFGGIESHILQLCKGLIKMGLSTRVIFLNNDGRHPLQPLLRAANIQYTVCDSTHYLEHLTKHPPKLLHTHGYKAGIISRLLAKLLRVPVVSTYHAAEPPQGKTIVYDWIDRYTAFLADVKFVVSDEVKHSIPFKAELAKNFIDMTGITLSQGQQIAYVGRFSKEKGIENLLHIARALPHIEIHCYGDGPEWQRIKKLDIGNLVLHGHHDMTSIWPQIGLLILPSLSEGLPMAALESMAHGIPVVASEVGELPKLIKHGQNGWLKPVGDINGYVRCIKTWRTISNTTRAKISHQAQITIEDYYSLEAVLPHLIERYQSTFAA